MIKTELEMLEFELTLACPMHCKHCFEKRELGNMSITTFNNAIDFAIDTAKNSTNNKFSVLFTGGEPTLFDLNTISEGIDKLRANIICPLTLRMQTSLCYDLLPEHIALFKKLDKLATSWDYKVRYENPEMEAKFFNNLEKLRKEGIVPHVVITISDILVHEVTPEMFMSFIMACGIRSFDFNRFFTPHGYTAEQYSKVTKATAAEMGDWLFRAYKIWDKIKDDLGLFVFDFEGVTDGYYGVHYNQWSKNCPHNSLHITPLGKVKKCMDPVSLVVADVNTKEFYEDKYQEVLKAHHDYRESEACKTCKYFEYCQCGCPWMYHDETGCSIPKKVYEYLKLKDELKRE